MYAFPAHLSHVPKLQLGIPSRVPEIGKCSTPQISSYSHCTHVCCYLVRFLYKKPALHIMALGTNAFLLQLNYVSEQRKELRYGLPGLQPKYLSAAPWHPSAVPVGRCSWEGETGIYGHNKLTTAWFPIGRSPKRISRNTLLPIIKYKWKQIK
jgi:hypothetical protein